MDFKKEDLKVIEQSSDYLVVDYQGHKLKIIIKGVKLKKVLKLNKIMKKNNDNLDDMLEAMNEIGIKVIKLS